jgi:pyridoxine kinase
MIAAMNVLSVQSWVSYGHVGNAAAMFPMQRLGHEVWGIHTVQFSNHTGYGAWKGQVFPADLIGELVTGIAERGVLPNCDAVLSGYMGDASTGAAILDAVARVKAANPKALYCCDPVIGDVGRGIFVREGIADFMRERTVPAADIITPNHFELELLAGRPVRKVADVAKALDVVHAMGPSVILVTSFIGDDTPGDHLDLLVSDRGQRWRVRTPLLSLDVNGAGDAIAALFLVHYLANASAVHALVKASSSIFSLLQRTAEAGARELLLVEAQQEFISPSWRFEAEAL